MKITSQGVLGGEIILAWLTCYSGERGGKRKAYLLGFLRKLRCDARNKLCCLLTPESGEGLSTAAEEVSLKDKNMVIAPIKKTGRAELIRQ